MTTDTTFTPVYSPWRHGGWYVNNVRHPSGAIGCVSRNFPDKKWRIVCDPRPFEQQPTFATRDDAARAEYALSRAPKPVSALPSEDKALVLRALENHRTECQRLAAECVAKYGECPAAEMMRTEAEDTSRVLSALT